MRALAIEGLCDVSGGSDWFATAQPFQTTLGELYGTFGFIGGAFRGLGTLTSKERTANAFWERWQAMDVGERHGAALDRVGAAAEDVFTNVADYTTTVFTPSDDQPFVDVLADIP